jgi:hypothetical protein
MKSRNPSHREGPTKREALGTPSAKERKHLRIEAKADAPPKKGGELTIRRAEPRAIRLHRIGDK